MIKYAIYGFQFIAALCLGVAVGNTFLTAGEMKPAVVLSGLDNPSGVCVQAGTNHLFLAARDGVHRVDASAKKAFPEITGYPTDIYGKGPKYNIGPLGVAFQGNDHLIVCDGSQVDGKEVVRVFHVGEKPLTTPIDQAKADITLGPIGPCPESPLGEGNFYAIAVNDSGIYITANGDDTKGWVLKAPIEHGKPGTLVPYLATKVATNVDAPVAITFSPKGDLVVGQMGEMTVPGDSLLTMYDAKTKELKSKLATGLHDIAGLAYSPKTGKLYGVDFAWADVSQGALVELTVDGEKVKVTKIASLMKPTALAFDADGNLYVTCFGTADKESAMTGELLMFPAGL